MDVIGRAHDDALAQLDGRAGQEAVDGAVGIGDFEISQRNATKNRCDRLGVIPDLVSHLLQLGGLVTENHEVGLLRNRGVGLDRLATYLGD